MVYRFLEHTADVKFQAEGESLEQAFLESALALREVIAGKIAVVPVERKEIAVKGTDINSLLYSFLEEFLFMLDSEGFLFSEIESIDMDKENFTLKAAVLGDKADNYNFTNDVKAVTYNDMFVKLDEDKKKWVCQVVLDV